MPPFNSVERKWIGQVMDSSEEMDIRDIRRKNLLRLIQLHGNQQNLANELGMSKQEMSDLKTGRSNMGNNKARAIEKALKLPDYWMDTHHPDKQDKVTEGFMKLWDQLSEEQRSSVVQIVKSFLPKSK